MNIEMTALLRQRCGGDIQEDWPQHKRAAKLEEIEAKAAAAVGPAPREDPAAGESGPSPGGESQGLSQRAYQILKERIFPFCDAYEKGLIKLDGQPVYIAGSGRNIYWVWTAEEAAAIAPRCKEVMALLAQLL